MTTHLEIHEVQKFCVKFDDGTYLRYDGDDTGRTPYFTLADLWSDARVAKAYSPKGGTVVPVKVVYEIG